MAKKKRGTGAGVTNSASKAEPAAKKARASNGTAKHGLAWLLGEIGIEEFKEKYFEQDALHVKRGSEGSKYYSAFNNVSTPDGLFKMMDSGEIPVYRVNMFRCRDGSTKETPQPPPSTAADVRRLFKEGWSIQWLQPQQEHGALAKLVAILESELGALVGVNAYLTPPGTQGLAPHYDDVEVIVLQLGGVKSWNLHKSTETSPLPPEAQTLPRYSSGDLPLDSLSPVFMKPVLNPGDLLYFPRGTIHHAPNQDSTLPSVHLTISTFQRQTLYDLTSKTFEEAMSEFWEDDASLRKALPWDALTSGAKCYPELCKAVAQKLRTVADACDREAQAAGGDDADGGCVSGALADLSAEFVQNRMPPTVGAEPPDSVSLVTPASTVAILDPSALALVPVSGAGDDDDEGAMKLVHCLNNSPTEHMMKHPPPPGGMLAAGDDEGEEEEDGEEEGEEGEKSEEEQGDGEEGQEIDAHAAAILKELCAKSPRVPLASRAKSGTIPAGITGDGLGSVLLRSKIPEKSWPEVCNVLTQLAAQGLIQVAQPGGGASGDDLQKGKKKKKLR